MTPEEVIDNTNDQKLREMLLGLNETIIECKHELSKAQEELDSAEMEFYFHSNLCSKGNRWVPIESETELPEHVIIYDDREGVYWGGMARLLGYDELDDIYGELIPGFYAWL